MTRIVFASCMSALASTTQKVWSEATAHKPDWLFLCGDNIYMDYFPHLNQSRAWSLQKFAQEMEARYAKQFTVTSFRNLVSSIPAGQVVGTWDDHDFAWNNCFGADPAYGMEAKKLVATALFHHYFAELNKRPLAAALPPLVMPDINNPPNGSLDTYRAFDLVHDSGTIRVLVCDGRTYRGKHPPGTMSGELLGATQEAWLFRELKQGTNPYLLVTGSTMTAGDDQSWDYYQDFFKNRFLPAVNNKLVMFMAGDVHENRLPPRVAGNPIEIVSSAAVLDFPLNKRNFGVLDIQGGEVRIFLYKRGAVQYTGVVSLGSGKFKTSMAALAKEAPITTNPKLATSQRAAALRKLKSKPKK
ncbi:MAG: alkaline phosphatase D family protein [Steroidobacteraceae bacterium]